MAVSSCLEGPICAQLHGIHPCEQHIVAIESISSWLCKFAHVLYYCLRNCATSTSANTTPVTLTLVDTIPATWTPADTTPLTLTPVDTTPATLTPVDTTPITWTPWDTTPATWTHSDLPHRDC